MMTRQGIKLSPQPVDLVEKTQCAYDRCIQTIPNGLAVQDQDQNLYCNHVCLDHHVEGLSKEDAQNITWAVVEVKYIQS